MTAPAIVVAGATMALTRRTVLRKAFLAPWHPLVQQIWLYALADAQRITGVAVHHSTLVITHHHTSVTASHANLPTFKQRLHRDVSCAIHTLLCRERYDAPRELFDDRPTHEMRLLDDAAQASHLIYEYLNTVAAGLVQRPEHMPNRVLDFGLWKTGYIEVDRPPLYFGADRPERQRLYLTPPPLLYRAFGGDVDRLVHHMTRLSEDGIHALRAKRTRLPMGAKALRRLHPWSEPRTLRETGGAPMPTFRIGARGIVGQRHRIEAAVEVRGFRRTHRAARIARRDGNSTVCYPFGTYAARVHHGAPVEPSPSPNARVSLPGPLLADVQAELIASRRERGPAPHELLDDVRSALVEEAAEILEHANIDMLCRKRSSSTRANPLASLPELSTPLDDGQDLSPPLLRHRFDRRIDGGPASASRIVTLRDRRRGRTSRKRGSDPPE